MASESIASTSTSQYMPAKATAAFVASDVSSNDGFDWCQAQLGTCSQICVGSASQNTCDYTNFTYACECANGTTPDCTRFMQTLPYYICQDTYSQCIEAAVNDATGQLRCAQNEVCGTENATEYSLLAVQASSTQLTISPGIPSSSGTSSTSGTTGRTTAASLGSTSKSASASTTASAASSSSSSPPSVASGGGLSTGAIAGIAVGCALAGIIVCALAFFSFRRHRSQKKQKAAAATPTTDHPPSGPGSHGKSELPGDMAKTPSQGQWHANIEHKPEMVTNANRHELDDTQVSGTLKAPWSIHPEEAELEGR